MARREIGVDGLIGGASQQSGGGLIPGASFPLPSNCINESIIYVLTTLSLIVVNVSLVVLPDYSFRLFGRLITMVGGWGFQQIE